MRMTNFQEPPKRAATRAARTVEDKNLPDVLIPSSKKILFIASIPAKKDNLSCFGNELVVGNGSHFLNIVAKNPLNPVNKVIKVNEVTPHLCCIIEQSG